MVVALVSLLLLPCVLCEKADLSKYVGFRIKNDKSLIAFGDKQEIQLFRDTAGVLQIVAPKGVNFVAPSIENEGEPIASGGDDGSSGSSEMSSKMQAMEQKMNALQKMLEDIGITGHVARVKDLVCKAGWQGDGCKTPCTNAGAHEFYSSVGCATTKCKVDLKLGFHYAPRDQHSLKNPTIDPGCEQVACKNKSDRQVYIPGAVGDKCNTKTCTTATYIKDNKCVPCPDDYDCDGTAKKPVKSPCKDAAKMVPKEGLYSWFKNSDLAKGGSSWASSVGKFTAKPTKGSVKTSKSAGNGASASIWTVSGSTASEYTFGNILANQYTICSVTRYTGGSRKRILTGSRSNWLHGHWNGGAGIAHYDGWVGSSSNQMGKKDDWVIMCGTSNAVLLHGKKVGTRGSNIAGNQAVVINSGPAGGEKSDWMVAEIITWNRKLSEAEMQSASAYMHKLIDGSLASC